MNNIHLFINYPLSGANTCKEEIDKLDQLLDLIPTFSQILPVGLNIKNPQCANQSRLVLHEAQHLKLWALNSKY